MKETGVVRKLDNLGRLVIPKEIRKCMRIKEGSPIEFGLLPSGEIVLCKYSLVNQISDYAEDFCDILNQIFDCIVIIGDRDKVISCSGGSKKQYINKKLSEEVLDIMDSQNSYMASIKDNTTILPLIEDDNITYYSQIAFPIIIEGEKEGIIILASQKSDINFDSTHIMVLKCIAKFLSKQME